MKWLREITEGGLGKSIAVSSAIVAIALAVWVFRSVFFDSGVAAANARVFIDASTGKPFNVDLGSGMSIPTPAPSGQSTGYPAELCYWTADGKPNDAPTPVLLNEWRGTNGPTFCPDCKRLVVGHNPRSGPGKKPSPTEAEYVAKRTSGKGAGLGRE